MNNEAKSDALNQCGDRRYTFVCSTERCIRALESFQPDDVETQAEQVMWLDLSKTQRGVESPLSLKKVETEEDYHVLYTVRKLVEEQYKMDSDELIAILVHDVKEKSKHLSGTWYLAYDASNLVGQIGLLTFKDSSGPIGRLQNVDIVPLAQGYGYGNHLLGSIIAVAQKQSMQALCLMARDKSWVMSWYQRLGFVPLGLYSPDGGIE